MNLIDENDNVPSFTKRIYYIDIPEDHPVDTDMSKPVGKVTAVDADAGNNAAIKYSIIGGNKASVFNINPETGDIYLQQSLDREVQVIARRESVKQFILLECYLLEIQCMCLKRDIAVKFDEKMCTHTKKKKITLHVHVAISGFIQVDHTRSRLGQPSKLEHDASDCQRSRR